MVFVECLAKKSFTMMALAKAHYRGEKSTNFLSTNLVFFVEFALLNAA
jgi:hypothetical protein